MKILIKLTLLSALSLSAFAQVDLTLLEQNKILLATPNIDERDLEDFITEFNKFPAILHQEMIKKGGKINLIHGDGVTADPTWNAGKKTFDGRGWEHVPGSGGAPYAKIPTRIVVNHLYDNHGSVNLVLHEHGHTLDNTYKDRGVSSSHAWKELMANNPEIKDYLHRCGNYCNNNENERFAELLSFYYHSEESRLDLEIKFPEIAQFFKEFVNIKDVTYSKKKSTSPKDRKGKGLLRWLSE